MEPDLKQHFVCVAPRAAQRNPAPRARARIVDCGAINAPADKNGRIARRKAYISAIARRCPARARPRRGGTDLHRPSSIYNINIRTRAPTVLASKAAEMR